MCVRENHKTLDKLLEFYFNIPDDSKSKYERCTEYITQTQSCQNMNYIDFQKYKLNFTSQVFMYTQTSRLQIQEA